ncbi:MAG: ABC transporter permease [Candidatus Thermoplasmatota archaeon]|nr:ABC transporter permease [Candidatus Thermoplasmatota archaeon]
MKKLILISLGIEIPIFIMVLLSIALNYNPQDFISIAPYILPFILIFSSLTLIWFLMGKSGSFRVTYAFIKRRFQVFTSYKFQIIFTIFNIFLMVIIFYIVGKPFVEIMFASMSGGLLNYGGYDFLTFIIVGMIAWPMLLSGYSIASRKIRQEQYTGMFEIMIPTKYGVKVLPFASLLTGTLSSITMTISSLLVIIFLLHVDLKLGNPLALLGLISIIILSLLTMWELGLIFGGLTAIYKQLGPVSSILQTIMMFFCGIYIPVQILPAYIKPLSYALPLTYAFRAIRASMISGQGIMDYLWDVIVLFIFCVIMVIGGYIVFTKLLDKARKYGTVYGY